MPPVGPKGFEIPKASRGEEELKARIIREATDLHIHAFGLPRRTENRFSRQSVRAPHQTRQQEADRIETGKDEYTRVWTEIRGSNVRLHSDAVTYPVSPKKGSQSVDTSPLPETTRADIGIMGDITLYGHNEDGERTATEFLHLNPQQQLAVLGDLNDSIQLIAEQTATQQLLQA